MPDNTQLNVGSGGDLIRTVQKGSAKASSVILDIGVGASESFMVAGQTTMAGSIPVVIASNQSAVPAKIDQTTPGTTNKVESSTNARRNAGVLHRNVIASADRLSTPAAPTLSAVTESGSTLANVAYNVSVAAGNRWGSTPGGATATITPTASQAIRATIAQVSGADYYDLFLSTGSNPLWVGRITESQRASGGFIISAVGVTSAGGGAGAGAVDLGIVGTGSANNVIPFAFNNAYTPASPTPVNCAGYAKAVLHVKLAVTDLRSLPALNLLPFFQDQTSTGDWFADADQAVSILSAEGQPLEQQFTLEVNGATALAVLVSSIGGQGAACSVWVELA